VAWEAFLWVGFTFGRIDLDHAWFVCIAELFGDGMSWFACSVVTKQGGSERWDAAGLEDLVALE